MSEVIENKWGRLADIAEEAGSLRAGVDGDDGEFIGAIEKYGAGSVDVISSTHDAVADVFQQLDAA